LPALDVAGLACVPGPSARPDRDDDDGRQVPSKYWLTPILPWGVERLVGIGDGRELVIIDAASGLHWARLPLGRHRIRATAACLLAAGSENDARPGRLLVFTDAGPSWSLFDIDGKLLHQSSSVQWCPPSPEVVSQQLAPIAWRHLPPFLELVGLDDRAAVYAAEFYVEDGALELLTERLATTEGGYLAAARAAPQAVVAVSRTRIDWLGFRDERFHRLHKVNLSFPNAVACYASPMSQETLVICSDGFVIRVASPRRLGPTASGE
jgi:hypothetical protein